MNDRELMESAARAAGIEVWRGNRYQDEMLFRPASSGDGKFGGIEWNPLTDDADALRLAVKLKLDVFTGQGMRGDITTVCAPPEHDIESCGERHGDDPFAATRRAIVRAAAEIGKKD
ncbi:hypothetical protein [Burkholderia pseudomallei]|uniref:hypothetical protein n=1 Tax=Burkholderia pseudomallei TaxID=28450 RepID=UPI000C878314|nr:hypothetical protein [Burkholderia pseudomallei]